MSIQSERRRLREKLDHPDKLRKDEVLPVTSYDKAAELLRRPFAPEAVRFRVVEAWGADDKALTHAIVSPYIDARTAMARLNTVIPGMWAADFKASGPSMWCGITVRIGPLADDNFRISDVGEGGTDKARRSDALKRAAVSLGVGESLYAFPPMQINATEQEQAEVLPSGEPGGLLRPWIQDGEPWLKLTRKGEDYARDVYCRWLLKYGIPAFGRPLDHGNLTAESETVVTGPPRPRASREQAPTPQRRTPPKRQNRGETVVGAVGPGSVEYGMEAYRAVTADPEAVAQAELDAKLNATNGLVEERKACNALMVDISRMAGHEATAVYRLGEIEQAELDRDGPLEGLRKKVAALSSIALMPKVKEETSET